MEALSPHEPEYPERDGQPMSDNTLQFLWITMLQGNLDALLPDFVGGDLLWYPVQGDNRTRAAPDVMVALGRPKGRRGSYKQWEEDGIAPAVVFEVLSPGNTTEEMAEKHAFYERYGVEEYYVIDPDVPTLEVWLRRREVLRPARSAEEHISAVLGIRLVRREGQLAVFYPDGRPFLTFPELKAERDAVAAERDAATAKALRLAERLRALGLDPDEE
jgi:Uma2 family endonuclease